MATICEHEFEREDPKKPGYSLVEYDLYSRLGMTIRKNLQVGRFEIVSLNNGEVLYSYSDLQGVVRCANSLEDGRNTVIRCGLGCPLQRAVKPVRG